MIRRKQLTHFLFILAGAILLLSAAVWNGFPILYSDSSTYIASGFTLETPVDRPMFYGLFVWLTSINGISIWSTVFIQCLIVAYLIFITIRDFTRSDLTRTYFISIGLLSLLTALPFVTGQILADVFMPICFLSMIHLLYNDKLSRGPLIGLFFLFFLSNSMHMSHLSINMILVLVAMILHKFGRQKFKANLKHSYILIALILLSIPLMGSALSKSKHVFFTGKMAENGILQDYLREYCPEKDYKLCDCIDSIPRNTTDFLWDKSSPLYTRYGSWSDSKEDFSAIIRGTLTSPKYIGRHLKESVKSTFNQLLSFDIGDGNGSFDKESQLFERIKLYFPNDYETYLHSRQYHGKLLPDYIGGINLVMRTVVVIALVLILLMLIIHKLPEGLRKIAILLLIALLVNCFINSSLVIVAHRFGAKTIWLIPFIAALLLIDYIHDKLQSQKTSAPDQIL